MTNLTVPLDERVLLASGMTPLEAEYEMRILLAAKLYELGKLTCAQASGLAGMPVWSFMEALSRHGVSVVNSTAEQVEEDLRNA